MSQSTLNVTLIFTVYGSFHPVNYLFVTLIFLLYLLSIFSNISLMLIIYVESSLHKPMYIFLFNLAINGLIGSSAVWPKIMENLLSDTQESSYEGCLIQVFVVTVYGGTAYTILTVMAYDRYLSICKPLQYHSIMTSTKVKQLLAVVYIFPIASISGQVSLTSKLPLCRYNIQRLFCDNLSIVNLSCVKSNLNNVYGLCMFALIAVFPFVIVVLSYVKILLVSLKTSKEAQKKALSTCTPHLITFINFSLASLFSVIYNRVHLHLPAGVNIFFSLHYILIPPLLHPIVYGIKTQEIRKCLTKILRKNMIFAGSFGFLHLNPVSPLTTYNMY
ncbi:olfactory receptor 52K1-like [Megalops cyprinoides]|uniref:olfactory receptor 52K1-like n=1 Tax=Megalops cyprinoides TaxID=118141 RepID=UPI0018645CBF|nr:olfactory receptor 52K1-like [Megalops cyprinoides]